jgi:hypothetical protein
MTVTCIERTDMALSMHRVDDSWRSAYASPPPPGLNAGRICYATAYSLPPNTLHPLFPPNARTFIDIDYVSKCRTLSCCLTVLARVRGYEEAIGEPNRTTSSATSPT